MFPALFLIFLQARMCRAEGRGHSGIWRVPLTQRVQGPELGGGNRCAPRSHGTQICSGRGRLLPTVEVLTCLLSWIWWLAGAITATVYGKRLTARLLSK